MFSFISRHSIGKLRVLLVHLSWYQPVNRNANPERLGGQPLLYLLSLWYDPTNCFRGGRSEAVSSYYIMITQFSVEGYGWALTHIISVHFPVFRTCCCLPCALCNIASRTGECCLTPFCVPGALIALRARIRTLGGIQVNITGTCIMMPFSDLKIRCLPHIHKFLFDTWTQCCGFSKESSQYLGFGWVLREILVGKDQFTPPYIKMDPFASVFM